MGFQTKLAKKTEAYQRKISDTLINHIGNEVELVKIRITEDKYKDRTYELISDSTITAYINYPNNEIPISFGVDNTNPSQTLHLYDLLPIEMYAKFEDDVLFGDILFQKIKVNPNGDPNSSDSYRLLALQVVDVSVRASVSVVWRKYELAPYTLDIVSDLPELQTIIDNYLNEPWIV